VRFVTEMAGMAGPAGERAGPERTAAPGALTRRGPGSVVISAVSVLSAFGRGVEPLLSAAIEGRPAFQPVERFDVGGRRAKSAAAASGSPDLAQELLRAVGEVCDEAGLSRAERLDCRLFLAVHGDPSLARTAIADRLGHGADVFAATIARAGGLSDTARVYTSACVAASTAVADAAALIARGRAKRVVVAAGYLVEPDQFGLFDAGRALAVDGRVRPFSAGRGGLLLGDAVCAIVIEAADVCRVEPLVRIAGWGRSGDAYHVCQPRPDGTGLARAIAAALHRGSIQPTDIGYVNAHGSGTKQSDVAETAALRFALGDAADKVTVSSTKSIHGQALEAGALLELIVTSAALRAGRLPVNAGFLGPDDDCRLNLVLEPAAATNHEYALSLNVAFGGANTALLVGAP
jgi:3-oxoacyl-[acyl-carrier-protein] synthase II